MKKVNLGNEAAVAVANISYLQGMFGMTDAVMASKMGISRATWANRKSRPQMMTLREMQLAAGYFSKNGIAVSAAQLMTPFAPAEIVPAEVSA